MALTFSASPGEHFLKGIDTGSGMFARLMQPILEREKMAQLERHFQEELALRKAAAGRAAAAADPRTQFNKIKELMKLFGQEEGQIEEKPKQSYIAPIGNIFGQGGQPNAQNENQALSSYITGAPLDFNRDQNNVAAMLASDPDLVHLLELPFPERGSYVPSIGNQFKAESSIPEAPGFQQGSALPQVPQFPQEPETLPEITPDEAPAREPGIFDEEYIKKALLYKYLKIPMPKTAGEKGATLTGAARDAESMELLRQKYGENSPVYQDALAQVTAEEERQKNLSEIRKRTLGGLKTGERWMKDEQGNITGKETPLTATERAEYKGRGFFNNVFPQISAGLAPFSGTGSLRNFENAALNYNSNPEAKKLIDDYFLAKKLLTAGVVKESSTLASGKQKATYQQLRESLDSSDIPKTMASIVKQFQLPSSVASLADKRFIDAINDATTRGEKSVPAFQKQFFNPEEQYKYENAPSKNKEETTVINGKKYKKIDGEWYEAQ